MEAPKTQMQSFVLRLKVVMKFKIEPTADDALLNNCALMMSQSDPWIRLKRNLSGCREAMRGDDKEVYVAVEEGHLLGFIVLQMAGVFKGYIQSICVAPGRRGSG